jgi:hypothetical protein
VTLGTGRPDRDYAGAQQALHDRGLASSLSAEIPASDALTVTRGDDVLTEIQTVTNYLNGQAGVPWPPPDSPYRLERTVASVPGNINEGWNAAAQQGAAPGMSVEMPPVRDVLVGGMSYAEALNYAPAPLTDNLGSLRGPYAEPGRELRPGFGATPWQTTKLVVPALVIGAILWFGMGPSGGE